MTHLATGGPQPPEYLLLQLIRLFPGKTPAEIRAIPLEDILPLLTCLAVEHQIAHPESTADA